MIAELKATFKGTTADNMVSIVTSREMIGSTGQEGNELPGLLTDGSLLRLTLGSTKMLREAKAFGVKRNLFSVLEENLVLCVREAFPGCRVVEHKTQKRLLMKKFTGFAFFISSQ